MTLMNTCIQDPNPCRVIGVLDDGIASLGATALAYLRSADVVVGAARTLALFAREFKPDAVLHDLTGRMKAVPEWVRAAREDRRSCVVLATGDPLCHGIAPYLAQHLCVRAIDILPNLSTLQLACARIGLAWQDARIVSDARARRGRVGARRPALARPVCAGAGAACATRACWC